MSDAPARCLDCDAPLSGPFCARCGQKASSTKASFWHLAGEAIGEIFSIDSRLARTVRPFFFSPGLLSREWATGRRTRYSSPLKLYLFCSAVFFLSLAAGHPTTKLSVGGSGDGGVRSGLHIDTGRGDGGAEDWLDERVESQVERLKKLDAADPLELQRRLGQELVGNVPKVMFVLLPLFALLLRLLYFRRDRFYVDHFVFALHEHAFAYLVFTVTALTGSGWILFGAIVAVTVHLAAGLKAMHGQGWALTLVKLVALGIVYGILLAFGIGAAALIGIFSV
jgi:hypothetical protein